MSRFKYNCMLMKGTFLYTNQEQIILLSWWRNHHFLKVPIRRSQNRIKGERHARITFADEHDVLILLVSTFKASHSFASVTNARP